MERSYRELVNALEYQYSSAVLERIAEELTYDSKYGYVLGWTIIAIKRWLER